MKRLRISGLWLSCVMAGQASSTDGVSVKAFGAKGDGIADDTAAIQRALNAACGDRFTIASVTGAGVSPIVVTTPRRRHS